MIPLRDSQNSKSYPFVNITLIILNVLFYFGQPTQGEALVGFLSKYGIVPAHYFINVISHQLNIIEQVVPFFSFMFLHGGILHLIGNMWSLYIFGDNVEDTLGSMRYLAFYIACGIASGLAHIVSDPTSQIPTIGASGAISGVMGAYMLLFPKARILTIFFYIFLEVPAIVFLGFWFLFQFLSAAASQGQSGGIAWWAHIGGFISGIILLKLFTLLPEFKISGIPRLKIQKRSTSAIEVIRPIALDNDLHLYGNLVISEREAEMGSRKLIALEFRG
ncbi:MAG: rhomboid family intramembrane serine protease, partial [Pseudomonadota bacterium]